LDGEWQFAYDDQERWSDPQAVVFDRTIRVPFPPESEASGIGDRGFHPVCWYLKRTVLPSEYTGERVLLHFGAVDYEATVWVNGQLVAQHRGGHTPFYADITVALAGAGQLEIIVRVRDDPHDL